MVRYALIGGLVLAITGSALAIAHGKFNNRMLFNEIQQLQRQLDGLQMEWGQLLIEEHALADPARIEAVARKRLQMQMPNPSEINFIHLPATEPHD